MGKSVSCSIIAVLLAFCAAAAPAQTTDCYKSSGLLFFQDVVELVSWEKDVERGCWDLRLRLRGGSGSPQGHAMICEGNACSPQLPLREGIYWQKGSPLDQNVFEVTREENGSCADVTFCVLPIDPEQPMVVDFAAFFEEGYFLTPQPTWQPSWSRGVFGLSALYGKTRKHCQDDGDDTPLPVGSICL